VLKQTRSTRMLSSALGVSRHRLSQSVSDQTSRNQRSDKTPIDSMNKIREYYLRDSSSRLTTGKKQTRTHKGEKQQIRYLSDSIHNLWTRFDSEFSELSVSRTLFYYSRPFFVLQPRLSDREQCGCIKCCNLQVFTIEDFLAMRDCLTTVFYIFML
jgi:hypothetical protein